MRTFRVELTKYDLKTFGVGQDQRLERMAALGEK
jgi:hypothetical protein